MELLTIAGTGHRPPRLGLDYTPASNRLLTQFAQEQLERIRPSIHAIISGVSQGWDMCLAHAALNLGIDLVCAVPFEGQAERWPEQAKQRYHAILKKAKKVHIVCPGGYEARKYLVRDRYMVDNADMVLALLDDGPERSGTRATVEYAMKKGIGVRNVWSDWQSFLLNNGVTLPGGTHHATGIPGLGEAEARGGSY